MKKQLLILLVLIMGLNSYSQISFEKGYFINNDGIKTECLIKNLDWKYNPSSFHFKINKNDTPKNNSIESVKEFAISNDTKYVRFKGKIDKSSEIVNEMGRSRDPEFVDGQIFLRFLLEGSANLYIYEEDQLTKYFYKYGESKIEQLLYKRYLTTDEKTKKRSDYNFADKLGENNTFKQQLWNNLKCENISLQNIENVKYKKYDLKRIFKKYLECQNSKYIDFEKRKKKNSDLFNLNIRPGLNISGLNINNALSKREINFDKISGIRFGIEAEFILPFYNNKWAVIIEPTYQQYKTEKLSVLNEFFGLQTVANVIVDYKSIELPAGIRYYSFLNSKSKLFMNILYVYDIDLPSTITSDRKDIIDLTINARGSLAYGVGFNYLNKYTLEVRYNNRNITGDYTFWSSDYRTFSLIFGYGIF